MTSKSQVHLIPWDPDSADHVDRLFKHRQRCGWDIDKVRPLWQEKQRLGLKCIYWITIPPGSPDAEEKMKLHFELFPADKSPLQDTSASIRGTSRTPTQELFYPVGHISLDSENPGTEKLGLRLPSESVYWIKTFYVTKALQGQGIGRAAMDVVESMAIDDPLCARTLALDTVHRDDSISLAIAKTGQPPKMTNQEWYERRGYQLIHTVQNFYWSPREDGHMPDLLTVFMKKDIA